MPISWLKVEEYGLIVGYDEYMRYVLHCVVEALDPIYMEHVNEQIKTNKSSK